MCREIISFSGKNHGYCACISDALSQAEPRCEVAINHVSTVGRISHDCQPSPDEKLCQPLQYQPSIPIALVEPGLWLNVSVNVSKKRVNAGIRPLEYAGKPTLKTLPVRGAVFGSRKAANGAAPDTKLYIHRMRSASRRRTKNCLQNASRMRVKILRKNKVGKGQKHRRKQKPAETEVSVFPTTENLVSR